MILLDTHVLVWMDTEAPALGRTARRLIQQAIVSKGTTLEPIIDEPTTHD